MNYYEKIVILDPNLDDGSVEEIVEKIRDVIIKQGGEILKTENWGRRKLAYILNKQQKGNYILLQFKAPPPTISELEKLCNVVDSVLKFMVVKLTKKKQIEALMPSPAPASSQTDPQAEQADGTSGDAAAAAEEKAVESGEGTVSQGG
ncbi:MAG: 30S ribosomal protein S6 [Deferribacteres bacterium]|nr:30S ribosomal protein S6 [Deferribacteres bacterium]